MLKVCTISQKGDRSYNEDFLGYTEIKEEKKSCLILADGLGGHGKGEVASELVVEDIKANFQYNKLCDYDSIVQYLEHAQHKLLQTQDEQNCTNQMKTTCVVLTVDSNIATWTHIGDSRMYHFCKGSYVHTNDNSIPWMLYKSGEITKEEVRHHPDRNKLYSVMGSPWNNNPFRPNSTILQDNDAMLLCSDGFWEHIDESKMIELLDIANTPDEWLSMMEKEVVENGQGKNMDNYSAIAVFFSEEDIEHSQNHQEEIKELNSRNRDKEKNKRKPKRLVALGILVILIVVLVSIILAEICFDFSTRLEYNDAVKYYENEMYDEALDKFEQTYKYKDSGEYIIKARLAKAQIYRDDGSIEEAKDIEMTVFNDWKLTHNDKYGSHLARYYFYNDMYLASHFVLCNMEDNAELIDLYHITSDYIYNDYISTSGSFSAFVDKDGNFAAAGDNTIRGLNIYAQNSRIIYEIYPNNFRDIFSVACGSSFVIALNNSGSFSATMPYTLNNDNITNVMSVSAEKETYMMLLDDRTVYAGDGMQSILSGWTDIIDIDTGEDIYAALGSNGKVTVVDKAGNVISPNTSIAKWENVIKVVAGGSKVYGLCIDGTVYYYSPLIENGEIIKLEDKYHDIIKMDACGEYFVAVTKDNHIVTNAPYLLSYDENIECIDAKVGYSHWYYFGVNQKRAIILWLKSDGSIGYSHADYNAESADYVDISQIGDIRTK